VAPSSRSDWYSCFTDKGFYAALAAGPLVWLVVALLWPRVESSPLTVKLFLIAVLVYPVLEEIVFRGALQGWLLGFPRFSRYLVAPLTGANLITSVVFTLFHFINHHPLMASLVFFPSLVFGWARDRFGNLVAPVILHAFYNAGFLWFIR